MVSQFREIGTETETILKIWGPPIPMHHQCVCVRACMHACMCQVSILAAFLRYKWSWPIFRDQAPGRFDDDESRFNDTSTHEGHLHQNGVLTWFCNEMAILISHICIKCKTRMTGSSENTSPHCRNKPLNDAWYPWLNTWLEFTVVSLIMASVRYGPKGLLRQSGCCMF